MDNFYTYTPSSSQLNTGIFEFDSVYSGNTTDVTQTSSGSGVHNYRDLTLNLRIQDRDGQEVTDARDFLKSAFLTEANISVLEPDGTVAYANYQSGYKQSSYTFTQQNNIDIFGFYAPHFGIKTEIKDRDDNVTTSEFYFYGNRPRVSSITVTDTATGHKFTSSAGSASTQVLSGVSGQLKIDFNFLNSPEYTNFDHVDVYWASGSTYFDSNPLSADHLAATKTLSQNKTQSVFLFEENIPQFTGSHLYLTIKPYSTIGLGDQWTVGPFKFEYAEKPNTNYLTEISSGDVTGALGFTPISSSQEEQDLQNVLTQGNVATTGMTVSDILVNPGDLEVRAGDITLAGQGSFFNINSSAEGIRVIAGAGGQSLIRSLRTSESSTAVSAMVVETNKMMVQVSGAGDVNSAESNESNEIGSYASAILLGTRNKIFGDFDGIVAGTRNVISGNADFNFIGAGSGLDILNSDYSSSIGGVNNDISGSSYAVIGGGKDNSILTSDYGFIGGGLDNTISGAAGAQVFGSYIDVVNQGAVYLSDNDNRTKQSDADDALFLDFSGGVFSKTGEFNIAGGDFSVDGSNGRLFGVTDEVTGTVFSVNDAAGLPIVEVESTSTYDKITMGEYGSDLIVLSGQTSAQLTGSQIASQSWVGQQGFLTSETDDQTLNEVLAQGNTSSYGISVNQITGTALTIDTDTLFVDSTNNRVGIGTTNPIAKLDVLGTSGGPTVFDYSYTTNAGLRIHGDESALDIVGTDAGNHASTILLRNGNEGFGLINSPSSSALHFRSFTANADAFSIHSAAGVNVSSLIDVITLQKSGNVGIGNASPQAKLHITGTVNTDDTKLYLTENTNLLGAYFKYNGDANINFIGGLDTTERPVISYPRDGSTLSLSTGSSTALHIDSSRNVGIGTTSPEANLHILKDSANGQAYERLIIDGHTQSTIASGSSQAITFKGSGNGYAGAVGGYGNGTVGGIGVWGGSTNSGSPDVFVKSGNVGIGTTSPNALLSVSHATAPTFRLSRTGTGQIWQQSIDSSGRLLINEAASEGGTQYTRLAIDDDGNVGIGTTNPNVKLHVEGDPNAAGVLGRFYGSATHGALLQFHRGASYNWLAGIGGGSASAGVPTSYFGIVESGNSPRLVIAHTTGNVGIGTTNPNAKLNVAGDVRAENSRFLAGRGTAAAPAYRFHDDGDTGMFNIASNILAFATSGSERIRISSAGAIKFNNYGAGTFTGTVTQKLGVDSSGNVIEMPIGAGPVDGSGTANYLARWIDSDTLGIGAAYDNGTNVGIGITNPLEKLHVGGDIRVGDGGASDYNRVEFTRYGGAVVGAVGWHTDANFYVGGHPLYGPTAGNIVRVYGFGADVRLGDSVNGDVLTVDATNGNVGIGTVNPAQKLEVVGQAIIDGGVGVSSSGTLHLRQKGNTAADGLAITSANGVSHRIWKDVNGKLNIGPSSLPSSFVQDLSGNVGIGLTNPNDILQVKSSMSIVDSDGTNVHCQLSSNASEGVLRIHNGANWGLIARGQSNNPYLGTYYGGSLNIVGFSASDGSTIQGTLATFDFSNSQFKLYDDKQLVIGNGADLRIFHNGSHSYIHNDTGNLYIENDTTDGDIIFKSDNGAGGLQEYLRFDGSSVGITVSATQGMVFFDNIKAKFGNNDDLQIYHDGQYSYIDQPAGLLRVSAPAFEIVNAAKNAYIARFLEGGNGTENVQLYYSGAKKFETTTSGVSVTGGADAIAVITGTTTAARLDLKTDSHHRFWQTIESDGRFRLYNQTTSVEQLTVLSGGNVGIGADNPAGILEVAGNTDTNSNFLIIRDKDSTAGSARPSIRFAKSDGTVLGQLLALDGTNQRLQFSGDNTQDPHLTIYNNGSVGVGITTPNTSYGLNVVNTTYTALFESDDSIAVMKLANTTTGTGALNGLEFYINGVSDSAINAYGMPFSIKTGATNGANPTERLKITSGGDVVINETGASVDFRVEGNTDANLLFVDGSADRVGIGTTSPGSKLVVAGGTDTSYNDGTLKVVGNIALNSANNLNPALNRWALRVRAGGTEGSFDIYDARQSLSRLTVNSSGEVGIGTTSPAEKLDVNGTFRVVDDATFNSDVVLQNYQSGTVSTAMAAFKKGFTVTMPESNDMQGNPYFMSDLAYFNKKGGTVTATGLTGSYTWDTLFRADAEFVSISSSEYSGSTFTLELSDVDDVNALSYGAYCGITFGASAWKPSSVVVEFSTDDGSTYTTALNSSASNYFYYTKLSNAGTTIKNIKFTIGLPSGSSIRIANIFATDYNGQGMKNYFVPSDGGTYFGDVTWLDSQKAKFGSGSDLQIYHDGSDSYIDDASGTGSLYVNTNAFRVHSADGSDEMIKAVEGASGGVFLYHNNALKLSTANNGIAVAGNVIASNNVYANGANGFVFGSSTSEGEYIYRNGNDIRVLAGGADRLTVDGDNGNVGIGTTSPESKLHVQGALLLQVNAFDQNSSEDSTTNPSTATPEFMRIGHTGTYSDGRYTHEWVKLDRVGNLPLYLRQSKGTANSFENIARFGEHSYSTHRFEVFGTIAASGATIKGNTFINDGYLKITAAAPNLIFTVPSGGLDSRIYNDGSGNFIVGHGTNSDTPTERLRITSSGNVGIGTTSPNAKLQINSAATSTDSNTLRISHTRSDANVPTEAVLIDMNLSGADNTTTDRTNSGLKIDLDSSANGDAANEHRIYGVETDVKFNGFSDISRGGYFYAESNYTGGKTAQLAGVYGIAAHDANSTSGGVSNMYGVFGDSSIQDLGDVDNAFGGYFSVTIGDNRGDANVGVTKGVEGEIKIDKSTAIDYGTMIGVSSIIDNNEGSTPNFGDQYLFKGDYQGTKGTNAYGIYVEGDKNYFVGNVGIGIENPSRKLHIVQTSTTEAGVYVYSNAIHTGTGTQSLVSIRQDHASSTGTVLDVRGDGTGDKLIVWDTASVSLIVKDGGNVGIGADSPNARLELKGSTADATDNAFVARDSASASLFSIRNDGRVDATGDVVIGGNLTVSGTTTTIDTAILKVEDHNIELGNVSSPDSTTADGGGITLLAGSNEVDHKTIKWINSTSAWTFSERISIPAGSAAAPSLTFSNDTDTGLFRELSGTSELISFSTEGTKRAHISSAGIFSQANVYSASGGQFRNFSGVWKATTGTTGNGFQFISADATALTISSTGDIVASGSVTATSLIKSGGSSSEFLKADGSVDSNTYLTTGSASSTYLPLAGGTMTGNINLNDDIKVRFGGAQDLELYHSSAGDSYIVNKTGVLDIRNTVHGGDIKLQAENTSGTLQEYFRVDGGAELNIFYKDSFYGDGRKALFGDNSDLQIFHDGSHSYISDAGTGDLRIQGSNNIVFYSYLTSEVMAKMINNGGVELYHDSAKKFETTASGIQLTGTNTWGIYSDNTAATFDLNSTTRGFLFKNGNGNLVTIDNNGRVGIGVTPSSAELEVNGHFAATTKSFIIDNPKTGGKLQYGVVESDEHGVYVRGKSDQEVVELPEEWDWLVHEDSVTVQLTSVGQMQQLFVVEQNNKRIKVSGLAPNGQYNYVVHGTRKDVDALEKHLK